MDNSVILKGSPYGISVIINEGTDYTSIKNKVIEKFKASEGFFKGASVGISFEGIRLPDSCQFDLLSAIADNTSLDIVCLIDNSEETVTYYKDIIEGKDKDPDPETLRDYSTTVREDITPENSVRSSMGVVVMADVLPGGQVISGNDVIILGSAKGTVSAGTPDNKSAVVYAYDLKDCTLSIGGITERLESNGDSFFKKLKKSKNLIKAYVQDDKICFEQVM